MMAKMEWDFLNFKPEEFACSHSGEQKMNYEFVEKLQKLRSACDFPFVISSGYRCVEHPIEASKSRAGAHTTGCAVDVAVSGDKALKVLEVAMKHGVKRIGVNQKGKGRFIHLDMAEEAFPSPAIWSY